MCDAEDALRLSDNRRKRRKQTLIPRQELGDVDVFVKQEPCQQKLWRNPFYRCSDFRDFLKQKKETLDQIAPVDERSDTCADGLGNKTPGLESNVASVAISAKELQEIRKPSEIHDPPGNRGGMSGMYEPHSIQATLWKREPQELQGVTETQTFSEMRGIEAPPATPPGSPVPRAPETPPGSPVPRTPETQTPKTEPRSPGTPGTAKSAAYSSSSEVECLGAPPKVIEVVTLTSDDTEEDDDTLMVTIHQDISSDQDDDVTSFIVDR